MDPPPPYTDMQAHITGYENTRAYLYVGQFLTNVTVLSPHLPGGNRQGYRPSEWVSIPGSGFCLRQCIQICSGAHPASCPWGETGHSPQSSAEVKNKWSLTFTFTFWMLQIPVVGVLFTPRFRPSGTEVSNTGR